MESRLNLLVSTTVMAALAANSACNSIKPVHIEPTPLISPPTETTSPLVIPTQTSTEVPTEIPPTATKTVEQRFIIGPIDFANSPFTIDEGPELRRFLGHLFGTPQIYSADTPQAITSWDPEKVKGVDNVFSFAAKDPSAGNPYFVFVTDQPNHIFLDFHSLQLAPGELAREAVAHIIKNPDQAAELYKQTVVVNISGFSFDAEIVNEASIPQSFWLGEESTSPWGIYPSGDNIIFVRTDIIGTPDWIRNDKDPKHIYITVLSCVSGDGNVNISHPKYPGIPALTKGEAYRLNTTDRALLTLRITLP